MLTVTLKGVYYYCPCFTEGETVPRRPSDYLKSPRLSYYCENLPFILQALLEMLNDMIFLNYHFANNIGAYKVRKP